MPRHLRSTGLLVLGGMALLLAGRPAALAQQSPSPPRGSDDGASAEEDRERVSFERFLGLLEKNPRRGTALDRAYGYHVERGTLDAFLKTYRDRVAKAPGDGAGWMILGLLESQRGQDAAAVAAFRRAEETRPGDALPAYYLGQSLVLVGQPEEAAAAFERSLSRKPPRNDLLEVFQALGRVYQRSQKTKEALEVWNRLETLFPNDSRVQEQVASALAEEGQAEQALPRFEALARKVTDPFRRVQLAMQAADLKARLGRKEPAIQDFEALLEKISPESWLYREVRRKVEEIFLRNDDHPGLAAYYERWIKKNPEDVDALVRLGKAFASQGRSAEARAWLEKAVKLAPSRRELRIAVIDQLAIDQKFAEAAAQYEAMDKAEPNNPDTLRDWGAMLLRDTSRPEAARKAAAAEVWRKMLAARPKDPVTAAQVADLFRQAEMTDDALAQYRSAIALAPDNPQYYEYLGEYLHTLKRPDEALAAWSRIAEGANRNAKNLARFSEVLAGFGYTEKAIPALADAVKLEGDDFAIRLRLADLLHRVERYDEALAQLDAADKLAEKEEEKTAVLEAQVKNFQAADRLEAKTASLGKELAAGTDATAERWSRQARYLEAGGKLPEATAAIDRAISVDPRSVHAWALAARIRESAGNLADAADAFRRLGEIDRRNRAEYLVGVAKLEARLGRADAALKAGRDLLAAAPGNPEHYEFFAGLCMQLGKAEEGLDALRRAARVNSSDTKILLTLAENLASQFRTDEAIEMYWRAFDKADELDGKIGMISRLTELYLQRNQFDRLLARLQREQRESKQERAIAICLAQAYASSGDLGTARSELEHLLASNARDVQLLQQLSKLAEDEGDFESAAKYQKQLIEISPSEEGSTRLAQLHVRQGSLEEAQAIWTKMAAGHADSAKTLQAIDSLIGGEKLKAVLDITEPALRNDPRLWEFLYREGVAFAAQGKGDEASRRFRSLLDLKIGDDEKSAIVKGRTRDPKLRAAGARPSSFSQAQPLPIESRLGSIYEIRMATKLENREYYSSSPTKTSWAPPEFGQARMAAMGWLVSLDRAKGKSDKVVAEFRSAREKSPRDLQALWNWYYLNSMLNENGKAYEAARDLSRAAPADPEAQWVYLNSLGMRQFGGGQRYYVAPGTEGDDQTPPLAKEEVDQVLSSYRALRQRRPDMIQAQIVGNVAAELKRAKRTDDADRFYREAMEQAKQPPEIANVMSLAAARGDVDGLSGLIDRYEKLQAGRSGSAYGRYYFEGPHYAVSQCMSVRADAKAHGDILRLLDRYFAILRDHNERKAKDPGRARRSGAAYGVNNQPSYNIWVGRTPKYVQIAFPLPSESFDAGVVTVLRTAYELFKRDDLASDLLSHLRKQAEMSAGSPEGALISRLALSSVLWWDDDQDAAIAEFAKVAESSRADSDLRLSLAELYEKRGDPSEALAVVDAIQPLDNTVMQRREEQALRLAVVTGNLDRARHAAERLFGLRLDTDTQVRLAGQMNQLGMHELAESVLGRARRRAGNKANSLVGLMLQYQRQDKQDVAVQVALQILRGSSSLRVANPNYYNPDDPDPARNAALQVLARSGKLKELIGRAEEQVKRTPGSVQMHQALADYYKAAGQRDKARAELASVVKLRPDDASLRFTIATQFVQEGQADQAIEHYKAAIKKSPSFVGRSYYQIEQAFQQANKMNELYDLMEQVDLGSVGQSYYVTRIIERLMSDGKNRERALAMFRKAWDAFPQERQYLMGYISRGEIWQMPEMYDYARRSLIPEPSSFNAYNQWNAFQSITSYGANGKVNSTLGQFLEMAGEQNKVQALTKEVEETRRKIPAWTAGDALMALLHCRAGRYAEARALLPGVLKELKIDRGGGRQTTYTYWILGSEMEAHKETRDLALSLYEQSIQDAGSDPYSMLQYEYSPTKRLVALYKQDGRRADVRRVLLEAAKPKDLPNYDQEYIRQMRLQSLTALAKEMAEAGYPVDAAPLYNEALALIDGDTANAPNYVGDLNGMMRQARGGLTGLLEGLKPDDLVKSVGQLLGLDIAAGQGGDQPGGKEKGKGRGQAIDLVMFVHPRELDKAAVRSLVAEAMATAGRDKALREQVEKPLRAMCDRHPGDLSTRIALALESLASGDDGRSREALDGLEALLAKSPLEPIAEGGRANARQRAEAMDRIPLWFVARACSKDPKRKEVGDRFAAQAIEAARRQPDHRWMLAMLREQGQIALDRGDRALAEQTWGRLLDRILAPDGPGGQKPKKGANVPGPTPAPGPAAKAAIRRTSAQAPTAKAERSAPANRPAAPAGGDAAGTPILTLDRFEQAMQVAKLAAAKGMPALSLRAVRESFRGGPPVVVTTTDPRRAARMMIMRNGTEQEPTDEVAPKVVAHLGDLDTLWRRHDAPAGQVYEAIRDAVIPPSRPKEIFLFAQPIAPDSIARPKSGGAILAAWAARAGKVDELRRDVEARKASPLAELPATVLSALLALETKDAGRLNQALAAIGARANRDTLRNTAGLACHAALPALEVPEAKAQALAVLDAASKGFEDVNQPEPLGTLLTTIARSQFKGGDAEAGRKTLAHYLDAMDRTTLRYGGDYGLYQRKLFLQTAATEFARAGQWKDALGMLGRFVDAPAYPYGEPSPHIAIGMVARQMRSQPADQRYEALKEWTMPTPTRRIVRMLETSGTNDLPPAPFREAGGGEKPASPDSVLGTVSTLLDAAREANRLDDLAAASSEAVKQKVENAEVLDVLVEMSRGKTTGLKPRLEARREVLLRDDQAAQQPNRNNRPPNRATFNWSDYLLARLVIDRGGPDLIEPGVLLAEAVLKRAQQTQMVAAQSLIRTTIAAGQSRRAGAAELADHRGDSLGLWHPTSYRKPHNLEAGFAPSWWIKSGKYLAHLSGPDQDFLLFDYPLAGTFEFSADAFDGSSAEANISYAGLIAEALTGSKSGMVYPAGASERIDLPWRYNRKEDFNRLTVRVTPDKVRYLVNGHLFHEDDTPSPTSPWLGLYSIRTNLAPLRNLELKGAPSIPREVRLSHADRLEGWISSFYNESQPPKRTTTSADRFGNSKSVPIPRQAGGGSRSTAAVNPDEFDWVAKDGEILGRRLSATAAASTPPTPSPAGSAGSASSRLYYFRPLRDGDTLAYEFFHEPDQIVAHPTIDRLAFLLEPGGVRLRWMITGPDDASGLSADNIADEPASRPGTGPLPLKPGDWNLMKVTVSDGTATLELNGRAIYRQPLAGLNDRQFGFYHDKSRTAVKVRNIVLRGDWPESLSTAQLADIAAPAPSSPTSDASRQARHAMIGERFFIPEAAGVVLMARDLKPEERYKVLAEWVLPHPDHPTFRLQGDFTPVNPAEAKDAPAPAAAGESRTLSGGELVAPALDLVKTAADLGRLDELASRIEAAKVEGEVDRRGKLALQAIVQAAQKDDQKAVASLTELKALLAKIPDDLPRWGRWSELVAPAGVIHPGRPALNAPALVLLDGVAERAEKKNPGTTWEHQAKRLRATARRMAAGEPASPPSSSPADGLIAPKNWAPVTLATARTRGNGLPLPLWSFHRPGEISHEYGHLNDFMYFGAPLTGDFQVECELTAGKGQDLRVSYAGLAVGPKDDLKSIAIHRNGQEPSETSIAPPLEKLGDRYKYRLEVKGNGLASFVNGRKIHETSFPVGGTPWLALYCDGRRSGTVRKFTIAGNPQVPEQIDLSSAPDLVGWLADYHGESTSGEEPDWDKRGEEIIGRLRPEIPGSAQESILQYNRPMLEDGTISYEFYYEPGKVLTHPALDRVTFLLDPDGVRIHRLTDSPHDRVGLPADNSSVELNHRRGSSLSLKPNAWNRVELTLAGDRVSLRLNGREIYERPVESSNQRTFGLFHYADATEARVRNVTYRGNWPRMLPR